MSQSHLTLSPDDAGLQLSHEEFAEAEFQTPWRYERAEGSLIVMSPANYEHHRIVKVLRNHLGALELAHPELIKDVFQDGWVIIDENTERIPDIQVHLQGSPHTGHFPQQVPDLIFEVVSGQSADRQRDYETKRDEYQRIGVREYVIVDRFQQRITISRLDGKTYRETLLHLNEDYTSPLLPGLMIPVTEILKPT